MAAGGAAGLPSGTPSRIPASWLEKHRAPPGQPQTARFRTTWGALSTPAQYVAPQLLARFRGPGVLNSFSLDAFGTVTIGWQAVSIKAGSGAQVVSPITSNVDWISTKLWTGFYTTNGGAPPAGAGNFAGGYVWPIQEIINNGNSAYSFVDATSGTGGSAEPALVENFATAQGFTVGQSVNFTSSFANGYTNISGLGSFSQSATTYYYGYVASVHYTYFAPIAFEDELLLNLSPYLPFNPSVAGTVNGISVTASVTISE